MKEKTHYADRRQRAAKRLLAGCKRIGCIYANIDQCAAGLDHIQVFTALADGEGCDHAAIQEHGKETPVSFNGITVRYKV